MKLFIVKLNYLNKKNQKLNYSTLQSVFKTVFVSAFPNIPWDIAKISFSCIIPFGKIIKENTSFDVQLTFARFTKEDVEFYVSRLLELHKDSFNSRFYEVKDYNISVINKEILLEKSLKYEALDEICIKLLTPLHINKKEKKLDKVAFVSLLQNRIKSLFDLEILIDELEFEVIPYVNYIELQERTTSSNNNQKINGFIGKIYIKGNLLQIMPYLLMLEASGFNRSYGLGSFTLLENEPFFQLSDELLHNSINEFIDEYDYFDFMGKELPIPFDKEIFIENIENQINNETYNFTPSKASILREDGKERLIEIQSFSDAFVSKVLLKTIQKPVENLFLKESIGFRTGVGREKALEFYKNYIAQGFEYLLKIDIKDFFDSINHDKLLEILSIYFPLKDKKIMDFIYKSVTNDYFLNKEIVTKEKGISTGNPLSPIISNLFLRELDCLLSKTEEIKFIRFADDILIFSKDAAYIENFLEEIKAYLKIIHLEVNEEKIQKCHYSEGINFLGYSLPEAEKSANILPYKKPLYVLDAYVYLALSNKTINIYKNYKLVQSIPINRIKEVILMNKTVLSTSLIKALANEKIPVILTSNTGYYISTITTNRKNTMDFMFQHNVWFNSFDNNSKLQIAKEFVSSKLERYLNFLQTKYRKDNLEFIHLLKSSLEELSLIQSIEVLRGKEGILARYWWKRFNSYIGNHAFHMKKREKSPVDKINSMLNFGYYILFNKINALLTAQGFNAYLGFLHSSNNDYESFTCDIQEIFRAEVDRIIIKMINLSIIKETSFAETKSGYYLKHEDKQRFIEFFEEEWSKKNKKADLSLNDELTIQIYNIKRHILHKEPMKFGMWRYL